jgi:hypothetical protein
MEDAGILQSDRRRLGDSGRRAGVTGTAIGRPPSLLVEAGRLGWRNAAVVAPALGVVWLLWLAVALDRAMAATALYNGMVSGWLDTVLRCVIAIATATQVALCVLLAGGLSQAVQESLSTGRRASVSALVVPARRAAWLLASAAVAAVPVVLLVAIAWSAVPSAPSYPLDWLASPLRHLVGDGVVGVLFPLALLVAVPLLAAAACTVPLAVGGGTNPFAAFVASIRLTAAQARLRNLPAAFVSSAGLMVPIALGALAVAVSDDNGPLDGQTSLVWFAQHVLWMRLTVIAVPAAIVLVAGVLLSAVYCRRVLTLSSGAVAEEALIVHPRRPWVMTAVAGVGGLVAVAIVAAVALGSLYAGYGYVHAGAGGRVTLRSGLSFVVSDPQENLVQTFRQWPSWLPCGQNTRWTSGSPWIGGAADAVGTFFEARSSMVSFCLAQSLYAPTAYRLHRAQMVPVFRESADETVTVRWVRGSRVVYVVTRLPGRMTGVLYIILRGTPGSPTPRDIVKAWRELQVRGASLPTL